MSKYVRYSRLAKKEKQRIVKQSLLLMGASLVMVIVLVAWGIPALVKYAGFLGEVKNSTQPIDANDSLAPFAPQLNIATEATQSAVFDVSGYAEAGATVQLFLNQTKAGETVSTQNGEFEILAVKLSEGANEFYAKAIDPAGNESQASTTKTVLFDNTPPHPRSR